MTSDETIVFVNSERVAVTHGATLLDAVRVWNEEEADALKLGNRIATDSRGIATSPDAPVHAGAIFRIGPKRSRAGESGTR